DDTSVIVKQAASRYPWIRAVDHDVNRGYGAALRSGFIAATGDVVAYSDSDNQFDLVEFADHLPLMEKADLVAGFRVYRFDPLPRLIVSWIYNRLVRILFRVPVRDVDCSFKLIRRDKLDRLVLMCDDFFIDTEIVARARKWNWRITEVGVRHYPRLAGRTTVKPSDVPRTLRRVAHMWFAIHYPNRAQHAARLTAQEAERRAVRGF
ncbi:MAG TPA: glycosyltransferase family 2 protein, partial [Acidimicrobiia bacterium]|nr:glycosyltransferase family 2 protein [Acidimicrobiia bacterium]